MNTAMPAIDTKFMQREEAETALVPIGNVAPDPEIELDEEQKAFRSWLIHDRQRVIDNINEITKSLDDAKEANHQKIYDRLLKATLDLLPIAKSMAISGLELDTLNTLRFFEDAQRQLPQVYEDKYDTIDKGIQIGLDLARIYNQIGDIDQVRRVLNTVQSALLPMLMHKDGPTTAARRYEENILMLQVDAGLSEDAISYATKDHRHPYHIEDGNPDLRSSRLLLTVALAQLNNNESPDVVRDSIMSALKPIPQDLDFRNEELFEIQTEATRLLLRNGDLNLALKTFANTTERCYMHRENNQLIDSLREYLMSEIIMNSSADEIGHLHEAANILSKKFRSWRSSPFDLIMKVVKNNADKIGVAIAYVEQCIPENEQAGKLAELAGVAGSANDKELELQLYELAANSLLQCIKPTSKDKIPNTENHEIIRDEKPLEFSIYAVASIIEGLSESNPELSRQVASATIEAMRDKLDSFKLKILFNIAEATGMLQELYDSLKNARTGDGFKIYNDTVLAFIVAGYCEAYNDFGDYLEYKSPSSVAGAIEDIFSERRPKGKPFTWTIRGEVVH